MTRKQILRMQAAPNIGRKIRTGKILKAAAACIRRNTVYVHECFSFVD